MVHIWPCRLGGFVELRICFPFFFYYYYVCFSMTCFHKLLHPVFLNELFHEGLFALISFDFYFFLTQAYCLLKQYVWRRCTSMWVNILVKIK